MTASPRCGCTAETELYTLTCGREKGHPGAHIEFRPTVSICFGHGFAPSRGATQRGATPRGAAQRPAPHPTGFTSVNTKEGG